MKFIRLFLHHVQLALQVVIFLLKMVNLALEVLLDFIDHLLNLGIVQPSHLWIDLSLDNLFFTSFRNNLVNCIELNLLRPLFYFFQANRRLQFATLDYFLRQLFSKNLDWTHQVGIVVQLVENVLEVLSIYSEFHEVAAVGVSNYLACTVKISLSFIHSIQTHQDARSIQ